MLYIHAYLKKHTARRAPCAWPVMLHKCLLNFKNYKTYFGYCRIPVILVRMLLPCHLSAAAVISEGQK